MELIAVSFLAGVLTVLAPCILPLLPVIVGGSMVDETAKPSLKRPLIITASLVASVILFTLLLKATTALLGIPTMVWSVVAGGIVVLFGVNLLRPQLWEKLMLATGWQLKTSNLLGSAQQRKGAAKDILLGAALGPVFNSCSPTYALIVAVILPASFGEGLMNLVAYGLGLGVILLLVALLGRTLTQKLGWLSNPGGWFKKTIGVIFIIVGLFVMFGIDKKVQTFVLENGWYDPVIKAEEALKQ